MNAKQNPEQSSVTANTTTNELTRKLAHYASHARFTAPPPNVRLETTRAFLNWMGCALGGCREPAVSLAVSTIAEVGGSPCSSIIGHGLRTDIASAAFINCMSSSVLAFDDAHLPTVTHPTGPVAAALFAFSEKNQVSGTEFINALALGMEFECRLSNVLVLPPSTFNVGFYVTGLTAPIGVAVAIGNLMQLNEQQMNWAIGLAASQSSGFRATHGTMAAHFRPGHAARSGIWAALFASKGFTSDEYALEADKGFFDVYCSQANLDLALDQLGERYELLSNGYKPYPCGIVIHPVLDACLDIRTQYNAYAELADVELHVHPLALKLTDVRTPKTPLESHVSLYHWAAATLIRGRAGVSEMRQDCIDDPDVSALRTRIQARPDSSLGSNQAVVQVTLKDGRTLRSHILNARGTTARPLTDSELDAKFKAQANLIMPTGKVEQLLQLCRELDSLQNVGKDIAAILHS